MQPTVAGRFVFLLPAWRRTETDSGLTYIDNELGDCWSGMSVNSVSRSVRVRLVSGRDNATAGRLFPSAPVRFATVIDNPMQLEDCPADSAPFWRTH